MEQQQKNSDHNRTISVYFCCGMWSWATACLSCRSLSLSHTPERDDLFKMTVRKY
ncbi:hypothetical protein EPR50_G00043050 [Perca flavescens]|uniref:Uncharacterized protein n=1 Tax=Perca flavescens TaxID=8167 RepID=A0A484DH75_PERFV|nr:hypothetical protein EPR50_G00043050 [Perca flavescens]